ncbi:hypothetical protein IAT38_004055 [Cryptococcus sp. DSM 104549]
MGLRFRNATPGTLLCLASTILLAIVSFNTPLLKGMYFLSASYSSGSLEGELKLGTLGFCHTLNGATNCTGPQVGYEFNPNDVFGVSLFDIPEAITKYLTYVLILHVIALAFSAIAMIVAIFAHSPTFPLICLSIWLAGIASTFTFFALVFDLAMFYIAKARIDKVSGASATIGISVWLTLAAWIILALSGCFFGIGNCCGSCRDNQDSGDPKNRYGRRRDDDGEEDYKMRMMAIDNERQRKQQQEQGLPSFQELTPLKDDSEDKYLYEQQAVGTRQPGLARDGSLLSGVGVGYGRRNNRTPANDYLLANQQPQAGYPGGWGQQAGYQGIQAPMPAARRLSDTTNAGEFAGVGAGGAGVEPSAAAGYGGQQGYYGEHQYAEQPNQYGTTAQQYGEQPYGNDQNQYGNGQYQNYNNVAPQAQTSYDPYTQTTYNDPYRATSTPPQAQAYTSQAPLAMPTPAPTSRSPPQQQGGYDYSGAASSESYDPGPRVTHADPYDAYDDGGGLGAIGVAAVTGSGRHERDYTGQTFGGQDQQGHAGPSSYGGDRGIQEPRPQHLVNQQTSSLLNSPVSPQDAARNDVVGQRPVGNGGYGGYGDELNVTGSDNRPPSYSAGGYAAPSGGGEKSSYR